MSYSIKPVIKGYSNKDNLTKVFIQVIYKRMKVYSPTIIQIPANNFSNGEVIKHLKKQKYNAEIAEHRSEIENRLLDALRKNKDLSKVQLEEAVKGRTSSKDTIAAYVEVLKEQLAGKLTKDRLKHYSGIAVKIEAFQQEARLCDISVKWLQSFETWLRKQPGRDGLMDGNTIQSKMTIMKALCSYAKEAGLMEEDQYKNYKCPKYEQKLPDFLTEDEMNRMYNLLQVMDRPGHQLAGYYFLLSCYTGYRISDLKRFNYKEMVKGDQLILRAKKNKRIVSIIIHTRLQKVLDEIHDKPLYLSEQKVREYVKDIAKDIGISRKIKVHTARHSFAMLLAESGFSLDDAAALLGDSKDVAKVYFRISDKRINNEVKNRLG